MMPTTLEALRQYQVALIVLLGLIALLSISLMVDAQQLRRAKDKAERLERELHDLRLEARLFQRAEGDLDRQFGAAFDEISRNLRR